MLERMSSKDHTVQIVAKRNWTIIDIYLSHLLIIQINFQVIILKSNPSIFQSLNLVITSRGKESLYFFIMPL